MVWLTLSFERLSIHSDITLGDSMLQPVCVCVCVCRAKAANATVNSEHLLEDIGGDASHRQ